MTPDEISELKELIELLKENGIGDFELERGDMKVHITFGHPAQPIAALPIEVARPAAAVVSQGIHAVAASSSAATEAAAEAEESLHIVKSPIVGTFYESSSPGSAAFVKIGDAIENGQVLCIVEAMKLMNEIESDAAGEVVKRLVTNGQPVEYGQPLFALRLPLKPMFRKLLIANRGEIALRVICAAKELGIRTVAIYSEADRNSLHVRFADEAICIGPPRSAESYLNVPAVISAAEIADVDAIHPGYGLLSENANFAEVCRASNIKFVGPTPEAIRLMGEKEKARQAMKRAKVPILPGSDGVLPSEEEAMAWARSVGFPVILKASAGGGGRGMRVVRSEEELPQLFQAAHTEAANAFGNGDLYMEKFIERPRHIEFQILADEHGNVMSLGERECSIQRRHQKLIEEAPSLQVTPKMREDIAKTLKRCLTAIGYQNAGTVEFLMDEDGKLYFIEMNTRIQVEHPVTEAVTGVDLVKAQLRIAAGESLSSILPETLQIRGHAIECRVNAEHPEKFTPSAGRITAFNVPGGNGVRVDTAQYAEGVVPPYYDSLIAKLIVHGKDRAEAMARMSRALEMFVVEGIYTTIPLHRKILEDQEFRDGSFDTKFMERFFERQKQG